jgi:N-acetylglucosaminyldiphosphoundecaprenol N-acetyl-beta-D-mannosaminyltransferase
MEGAQRRILELINAHRHAQVVTLGAEMAMLARRDPSYRDLVNAADLVVPDTIGVVYAARLLGCRMPQRVPGIELVERLCAECARLGLPIFLLGGAAGVAEGAAAALQTRYSGLSIAGTQHGYFEDRDSATIASRIASSGARLLLVALGFPRQEFWVRDHASELGALTCIGVGGSLDVISGRTARAPEVARRLGLEWLYRLVREPRRLGRQLALPQFAWLVALQALTQRRGSPSADSGQ